MPALRWFRSSIRPIFLGLMALGSALIALGSLVYFDPEELAPFVIEKLPLPLEDLYFAALKTHVVAAAFALPACLALSTRVILRAPRVHRWLGRLTAVVVLFALAPSGFYLAFWAKGGLPSTVGFLASGVIVVWAMVRGVSTARARDLVAHRRFALHVLAQLSVAVSSRALLFGLDAVGVDPDAAYVGSLWGPVIVSALVVELLTRRPLEKHHEASVARRPAPVLAGVRG
ncbi:MAG: DUF2306 domain-containing protein [Myxococcota bacterium]